MRKWIGLLAIVVLALIAAGAWWYASPWWTLQAMRDAARERNEAKLSAYVDYPALREDVKGDLRQFALGETAKAQPGGLANLGAALAVAVIDPLVDAAVSPAGVQAMFAQEQTAKTASTRDAPLTVKAPDKPVIDREGLNAFRVRNQDPSKGALVFHRFGLGWKLVGIDFPRTGY